jgi:hypothetical protein
MYKQILEAIKKNAEKITNTIREEIHVTPATWHYLVVPNEVISDRIFHVIKNVHLRLENWLKKNEPKNMLFAYYSDLGAERCKQGMPLEEVGMVLLLIRREVWNMIGPQIVVDNGFTLNQFVEINYLVNLFFVRIIQSTIAGYQNEQKRIFQEKRSGYRRKAPNFRA